MIDLRTRGLSLVVVALVAWGLVGCAGGSRDEAIPEEVFAANILGTAYLGQQKWSEAEASFREAIALRPKDPLPLNNLAVALIQQGRLDEAREQLQASLQSDGDFPYAHFNVGLIDKNEGIFEAAAEHFAAVAAQDPDDLLTQYNLGIVLSRIEREPEAEQAFRKALELNPTHVSTLYGLGRLLLQRGEQEEGARLVSLSQEIRARSGLDEAVGTQYGEQGPYAMGAEYPGDALRAPEPIAVRFEAASILAVSAPQFAMAPIGPQAASTLFAPGDKQLESWNDRGQRVDVPSFLPSGAQLLDLDAADLDDDGDVDLVLLLQHGGKLLYGVLDQEPGEEANVRMVWAGGGLQPAGIETESPLHAALVPVDRDHDGDLDLFWCWTGESPGCRLASNDGAGDFDIADSREHGFDAAGFVDGPIDVAFSDLDNDRDVDLLARHSGGVHLFTNQRDGSFEDIAASIGLGSSADSSGWALADLNKDGWVDLLLVQQDRPVLWTNRRGQLTRTEALSSLKGGSGGLLIFDYDNDGLLDVATGDAAGATRLYRNEGAGRWREAPSTDGLPDRETPRHASDVDADGDLDLIAYGDDVGFRLYRNEGGNANRWIAIQSEGVGDNRFGVGAKVEVLAGGLRQKFEVRGPEPLHLGLGQRDEVQSLRYLWPSGVLQDEVRQVADNRVRIEQLDRKGTSCPLLYAWGGGGWRFVTDFLGGAAVGYQQAPGRFNTPDTDEYIKIEPGLVPDADGRLRLRLNNQLEEVIWFDRVELIAVDHPAGSEVFPNERLMPAPPFPAFELFASNTIRPVAAATDQQGRDVTDQLAARDRNDVDGFALHRFKGYAEPHALTLDLGPFPRNERVVLLLDGWIDYADSSANIAAHQAGLALQPPRLRVADGAGGWRDTGHRMGFPAGLPKTMAVELTGLFSSKDHRVRIDTNMRIYWDRARVLLGGQELELRIRRLDPQQATLRYGGFPVEASPDGAKPDVYDPNEVDPYRGWKAHVGAYTPFGDVRQRLLAVDDIFVTTRNGDEIELRFEGLEPPAAGWTRSYLLYADGFGKDMDPNSAAADRLEPLPFHGMPYYPYGPDVLAPSRPVERGRIVTASPDGLHGAVPQAYAAAHPTR